MGKRIRFYHLWEAKAVFITIVATVSIVLALGIVFYRQELITYFKTLRYDTQTKEQLTNVEKKNLIRQTYLGSELIINHFSITYTYRVEGKTFIQTDVIPGTYVNGYKLNKIKNSQGRIILVKYNSDDPYKSMVELLEVKNNDSL